MNQNQNQSQQRKIQNPKTETPNTPQMNERDFLNDVLATEKYMTTSYSIALHEASHQSLFDDLLTIYTETEKAQRDIYNLMFKKGWYHVDAENPQNLQQSYQQFQGYSPQFPYSNGQMQ